MRKKGKFKKNMKKQNGITITTMVIAIILLIILAAISITTLRSSDKDLISEATEAKEGIEVATYKETLDVIEVQSVSKQISEGLSDEEYIDYFQEYAESESSLADATITRKTSTMLKIETPEGYCYYITPNGVVYAGIDGEYDEPEDLEEGDIEIAYSPEDWTNGSVTVTISMNIDTESTLMYSLDGSSWSEYTSSIEVTTNTTVYAALYRSGIYGTAVSEEITNIDKLSPNSFAVYVTVDDETTATVYGTTTDKSKTSLYGCSGIAYYAFSNDGGSTWAYTGSSSSENGYTFTGLTTDEQYTFMMKAVDNAGNETKSSSKTMTLLDVPDLDSSSVTFTFDEGDWTTGDVTVTVTITDDAIAEYIDDGLFTLEYSTDGGETWEEYDENSGITVSENCTIEVRVTDGTDSGESTSVDVTNIDSDTPTATSSSIDADTDSITWTVTGKDGTSGVKTIAFYIGTSSSSYSLKYTATCSTEATTSYSYSYTFSGLTSGTTYYLKAVVTDYAGNTSSDLKKTKATDTEVTSTSGITISYSTQTWTSGSVVITASTSSSYTIQYSLDATNWYDGSTSYYTYTMTDNGTVYFRLTDGDTPTDDYKTATVTWIDKEAPTLSGYSITEIDSTSATLTVESATDDYSGIYYIYFGISYDSGSTYTGSSNYQSTEYITSVSNSTKTFSSLSAETTYYFKIYACDYAGNTSEVYYITGTTTGDYEEFDNYEAGEGGIGYYADIAGDGDIDGYIYADVGVTITGGTWGSRNTGAASYSWTKVSSSKLRNYYISQEEYTDEYFGTAPVLTSIPGTTGTMRFYVIQLSDHTYANGSTATSSTNGLFVWYQAAYSSGISTYSSLTSTAFGEGWDNTLTMKEAWTNKTYGSQNSNSNKDDVWSLTELAADGVYITSSETDEETDSQWYVPSSGEWAAFAGLEGVTSSNYSSSFGLSGYYWSSSLYSSTGAYTAYFYGRLRRHEHHWLRRQRLLRQVRASWRDFLIRKD